MEVTGNNFQVKRNSPFTFSLHLDMSLFNKNYVCFLALNKWFVQKNSLNLGSIWIHKNGRIAHTNKDIYNVKQHLGHFSNLGLSEILLQIGQNPDVQTKTEFGAEFIETPLGMFLSQWQVKLSTNLPTKNDAPRYPLLAGGASPKKNSC